MIIRTITILFLVFAPLVCAMFFPRSTYAGAGSCGGQPGFSFAKKEGVSQGWLVPYNGGNQSFSGIPCKYRDATQEELNRIIESCCGGSLSSDCLNKTTLSSWELSYPTCSKRNLEVRKNSSGKFEAFDIERKIPDPTVTTTNSNIQSNQIFNTNIKTPNISEKILNWIMKSLNSLVSWIKH